MYDWNKLDSLITDDFKTMTLSAISNKHQISINGIRDRLIKLGVYKSGELQSGWKNEKINKIDAEKHYKKHREANESAGIFKLNEQKALEIINLKNQKISVAKIANTFNVSRQTVYNVLDGLYYSEAKKALEQGYKRAYTTK